jgi:hypothetical protein
MDKVTYIWKPAHMYTGASVQDKGCRNSHHFQWSAVAKRAPRPINDSIVVTIPIRK